MNNKIIPLIVGPISTNCWIYPFGEKTAIVIDPGDEPKLIISTLKEFGLSPKYILLTHGHFDHIAAIKDLADEYPMAEIAIHSADAHYLGADSYKSHCLSVSGAFGASSFLDMYFPAAKQGLPPAKHLLEEADTIGPFTVIHLPGHTPGSVAFWDESEKVLFSGDTLFAGGYGRCDLPGGDETKLLDSLKRLFAMDAGIRVFPGHGSATTIGQESGL